MGGTGSCGCREHQGTYENAQEEILCNSRSDNDNDRQPPTPHHNQTDMSEGQAGGQKTMEGGRGGRHEKPLKRCH